MCRDHRHIPVFGTPFICSHHLLAKSTNPALLEIKNHHRYALHLCCFISSKDFLLFHLLIMLTQFCVGEGIHQQGKASVRCKFSIIWHLKLELNGLRLWGLLCFLERFHNAKFFLGVLSMFISWKSTWEGMLTITPVDVCLLFSHIQEILLDILAG